MQRDRAKAFAETLRPVVTEIGANASLRKIAAALNARNIPTSGGDTWSAQTVSRLLERLQA
jgi:hypothetical protein